MMEEAIGSALLSSSANSTCKFAGPYSEGRPSRDLSAFTLIELSWCAEHTPLTRKNPMKIALNALISAAELPR